MHLTLLGTGDAAGMPLYGCNCEYCTAARRNHGQRRTPCSALLRLGDRQVLLDAGQPDLCERFPSGTIDAILLTHFHTDHVQGLFHLRWGIGETIPVFTPPDSEGCVDLFRHPGILEITPQRKFEAFKLGDMEVIPVPLLHSKPTFGYVFKHAGDRIAYLTDTKGLAPRSANYLSGLALDLMVIDCSFVHASEETGHNNLDDVLEIDARLQPKRTVLTHIGHDMDIWLKSNQGVLPSHITAGGDGMTVFPYPD